MQSSNCKGCGKPMIWADTVHGRKMPLDAVPVEDGNMVIIDGVAHTIGTDPLIDAVYDGPKYKSHHATCPKAAEFRQRDPKTEK